MKPGGLLRERAGRDGRRNTSRNILAGQRDCESPHCPILGAMEEAAAFCPQGSPLPNLAHDRGHARTARRRASVTREGNHARIAGLHQNKTIRLSRRMCKSCALSARWASSASPGRESLLANAVCARPQLWTTNLSWAQKPLDPQEHASHVHVSSLYPCLHHRA
jgi:hypothetical protein